MHWNILLHLVLFFVWFKGTPSKFSLIGNDSFYYKKKVQNGINFSLKNGIKTKFTVGVFCVLVWLSKCTLNVPPKTLTQTFP